jgi:hypothetical protein
MTTTMSYAIQLTKCEALQHQGEIAHTVKVTM